jgi:hypothetical protein
MTNFENIKDLKVSKVTDFEERLKLSFEDVLNLPPMLFGIIRWKKSIGRPPENLCNGFRIQVEERTPSQFRDLGGGNYDKAPGTGEWRLVTDSAPCSPSADEGDSYVVHFNVPGVHLTVLDGVYRVTPQLTGQWGAVRSLPGFRQLDPLAWYVPLRPEAHIATVEFEVLHKRRFWFS